MNIEEYIESGILELYVMGAASGPEERELLYLKDKYPEIEDALQLLELDMERLARTMAVVPPPGTLAKIYDGINELVETPKPDRLRLVPGKETSGYEFAPPRQEKYIEVEAETTHIRVHKNWKWAFAAVFILSKIFLICAIYFYLENRQAQEQIKELKSTTKQANHR